MSRFAIHNDKGAFYSDNRLTGIVPVPRAGDPSMNDLVQKFVPKFEGATIAQAIKYATEKDALEIVAHPDLSDATAFAGCQICETEFDTNDMAAIRDVGPA